MSDDEKITREDQHERILARARDIIANCPDDPMVATRQIAGHELADVFAREWGDWCLARDAAAHRQACLDVERGQA